jgi:DNA-binding winged helix-turn-helix (wHTH) protein
LELPEKPTPDVIQVGAWRAVRATGELLRDGASERLEPKVMDLLLLLAGRPGKAFTKDEIMEALWPDVIVGDDTLARAVSRLRRALADDAKTPAYIETLPKRGYRLIAEVRAGDIITPPSAAPGSLTAGLSGPSQPMLGAAAVAIVAIVVLVLALRPESRDQGTKEQILVERANDFYFQYKRTDNEAAITLFERVLVERPDHAPALAGLANALVQKVIRWPDEPGAREYTRLEDALKAGHTKSEAASLLLNRARSLAARAVALAPDDPAAHKAFGFVQSAGGEFDQAIASYQRAVALDPNAWGPLINIGDVLEISGRNAEALPYFESAYAAMTRVYDKEAARVRPWYAELGVVIADRYREKGAPADAETWYRRVLVYAPLHRQATERLAALLRSQGDLTGAVELCTTLKQRTGKECAAVP